MKGIAHAEQRQNSTTSSVSLLFDPAARFGPCSHMRALALFEEDHSSTPGQCQLVGYRCSTVAHQSSSINQKALASNELPPDGQLSSTSATSTAEPLKRSPFDDSDDQNPLGSQSLPPGSINMPQYFVGTGAVAPYCVNYYQFRVLISDSRLRRILKINGLGSNRLLPQLSQHRGGLLAAASTVRQRVVQADSREMLHLTVKLSDTRGRFFKGFSMLENARALPRVANDLSALGPGASSFNNEPLVELTMLLNSTQALPVRVSETVISYYFHQVVLADRIEINYMSNISPL